MLCRYRGNQGFKRLDHLRQHVRNYHHIDLDANIPYWRPRHCCEIIFRNAEDYATHCLDEHQSKPHKCAKSRCDRIGMNGFDTEELLKAHIKTDHLPEHPCDYPGCDRAGIKGYAVRWALDKHIRKVHEIEEIEEEDI